LKTEGAAALKEQFPGIEKFLADFMGTKPPMTDAEVVN
jgi:hypothetical protein